MRHSDGDSLRAGVRQAIYEADELSRRAHVESREPIAQALDGLRTALVHADEALGGGRSALPLLPDLARIVEEIAAFVARVGPDVRGAYEQGVAHFRQLLVALEAELASARELPFLLDYAGAGLCLGSAPFASSTAARVAGAALGASKLGVSWLSEHRRGVDRAWGASAIALPFVFGYWKRDPAIAALHVVAGATSILSSLLARRRAARGRER